MNQPLRLSQQLMNAYMLNDKDEIDRIKAEIEANRPRVTPKKNTFALNSMLNDDNASAIKIYEHLNNSLGSDWWEWEIETIEKMLWIKHAVALEDVNRDKVLAIRHLCRSDACFDDWYELNQLALAFSGSIADFEYLREPSPGMIINAIRSVNYIRPDNHGIFGNEPIAYICALLIDHGIYVPPPSIVFMILDKMRDMVSKETQGIWVQTLSRYNDLIDGKNTDINENPVDIQARRLFEAEIAANQYSK